MNNNYGTTDLNLFEGKYFFKCIWYGKDKNNNSIIEDKKGIKHTVDDMVKTVFDHEDYSWFNSDSPANEIYDCLGNPQTTILTEIKKYHHALHENNHQKQLQQYNQVKIMIETTTNNLRNKINNQ